MIAEGDGNEDVEPGAALDEVPGNLRPLTDVVLRWRRKVVDAAGVDVRTARDEIARDLEGRSVVQRRLAVAATGMHQRRVGVEQLAQSVDHPELRRGEDVDNGAAGDERGGLVRSAAAFEHAEAAGRPCALQVDVGAMGEQHVDERQVPARHRYRSAAKPAERFVHRRARFCVLGEQVRAASTSPASIARRNWSRGVSVIASIRRLSAAQLSKP